MLLGAIFGRHLFCNFLDLLSDFLSSKQHLATFWTVVCKQIVILWDAFIQETYKSSHVVFMGRISVTLSYSFYCLTPETEKYVNDKLYWEFVCIIIQFVSSENRREANRCKWLTLDNMQIRCCNVMNMLIRTWCYLGRVIWLFEQALSLDFPLALFGKSDQQTKLI